jgi:protein kinase C substrate 80K-H
MSHLNDGICDCCDGSDEYFGSCPDICNVVLAEEREARNKLVNAYTEGASQRTTEIEEYNVMIKDELAKIEKMEKIDIPALEESIEEKNTLSFSEKKKAVQDHIKNISFVIGGMIDAFDGSIDELSSLISSVCHLSGEMSEPGISKCLPLHKAGLDLGMVWEEEGHQNIVKRTIWSDDHLKLDFMNMLLKNEDISQGNEEQDTESSSYEDDDWDQKEEDMDDIDMEGNPIIKEEPHEEGLDAGLLERDFSSPMGMYRKSFYSQSKLIIRHIEELEKADSNEDNESAPVDPMSFQMVRNQLSRRIQYIERGEVFAKSAVTQIGVLGQEMDDIDSFKKELQKLLIGTIYHSRLGAVELMECQTLNMADLTGNTCISLYTALCSDDSTDESNSSTLIGRCKERLETECMITDTDDITIPQNVQDGYLGFYLPKERGPEDSYTTKFALMEITPYENTEMKMLDDQIKREKSRIAVMKHDLDDLKNKIGFDDNFKYGKEGELYSLRDKCFEIQSGKYTYKLCLFGGSFQIEDGGKTSLGKFESISTNETTGLRTMKWKGGVKCWNGPQRSATIFLTCGSQTQLLSSDEPQTCEYEFEMESHIGCDDLFKQNNNI